MKTSDPWIERLTSTDPVGREEAWREFFAEFDPRLTRSIEKKLRFSPQKVQSRIDDIRGDLLLILTQKLFADEIHTGVMNYAFGIATNLCKKANDASRDPRGEAFGSRMNIQPGHAQTGSQVLILKDIRRKIRTALSRFRDDITSGGVLPRPKEDTKSPFLQLLALDLPTIGEFEGMKKPADLREITALRPDTISRLRSSASKRLDDHLIPMAGSILAESSNNFDYEHLKHEQEFRDLWYESMIACIPLNGLFLDAHPSHAEDISLIRKLHLESCPQCMPVHAPSEETVDSWMQTARNSLPPL